MVNKPQKSPFLLLETFTLELSRELVPEKQFQLSTILIVKTQLQLGHFILHHVFAVNSHFLQFAAFSNVACSTT